ncbi:hypothetical protein [Pseudomonas mediterranea]|uniref:hypothetical protein n=1 Tax=Pseudomonas mediterranea TaxID=183795 RepID=UPI0006D8B703|nr:hypothetical protein [Pseudomonas mediterranea]
MKKTLDPDLCNPPPEPVEFAPFVLGREVRTFEPLQFDLLIANLPRPKVRPRTLKAARLVLVDKMPYREAAMVAHETQVFVRCAVISLMERLGYTGAAWFASDPAQALVFRRIPPEYHERVRALVSEAVAGWELEKTREAFGDWAQFGPYRTDLGVLDDTGLQVVDSEDK